MLLLLFFLLLKFSFFLGLRGLLRIFGFGFGSLFGGFGFCLQILFFIFLEFLGSFVSFPEGADDVGFLLDAVFNFVEVSVYRP